MLALIASVVCVGGCGTVPDSVRKLTVVDGALAITGGINITGVYSSGYVSIRRSSGPLSKLAIRIEDGSVSILLPSKGLCS